MNFKFDDPRLNMCQAEYNKLDPEQRLSMSHFDFASSTNIKEIEPWVSFLKDPRVTDRVNEELNIYKESQKRKLIARATTHDKSIGTAQMINALDKVGSDEQAKTGAMMIYSYVPLNAKEAQSPNAEVNKTDLFERG